MKKILLTVTAVMILFTGQVENWCQAKFSRFFAVKKTGGGFRPFFFNP